MKHWLILVFCLVVTNFTIGQNQGGEDCATAVDLGTLGGPDSCPGGAGFIGENTGTASISTMNPSCDQIGSNYDLWYSFEAPASGGVQIELELGTAARIEAAAWSDCSTEVWCSSSNVDGAMIMGLTPGETYIDYSCGRMPLQEGHSTFVFLPRTIHHRMITVMTHFRFPSHKARILAPSAVEDLISVILALLLRECNPSLLVEISEWEWMSGTK